MIQFNLLPDIKLEYIKMQRLKRVVVLISIVAVAFSAGLLILLLSFSAVQKQHISNQDADIARLRSELEDTPDLTRILSIQNQLNTLPELYNGRPAVNRLPTFLDQTTPNGVGLSRLTLDFSNSTIELTGRAPTLEMVNAYVDTLKYTTIKKDAGEESETSAFSGVVLNTFGRGVEGANFTISLSFDPYIFDISQEVELTVPNLVTTRAQVPSPDLFNGVIPTGEE